MKKLDLANRKKTYKSITNKQKAGGSNQDEVQK